MAVWKKRGNYSSVADLITSVSGMSVEELTAPQKVPASQIDHIPEAAALVKENIALGRPIVIVGDYDVDGVTSTAILVHMLRWYGVEPRTIIPRRFTDGYGISDRLLDGITGSLIITVDNGIAASEPLEKARAAGNQVLILDHHLSSAIPLVDVVVDPHVTDGESAFVDYCGAGLALKLSEQLIPFHGQVRELYYKLTVLACLGTICDVMPLKGDNRRIVREGLQIMCSRKGVSMLNPGLQELLKLGGDRPDEETVKFTLGPIINAVGRMYDAGSTSVLKALLCEDAAQAIAFASKMKQINEQRKNAVNTYYPQYLAQADPEKNVQVLYVSGVPEGVIGIIAGKLAETLRMPCFAFTDAKEEGIYKASGRSYGDFDLFQVVEFVRPLTTAAGGHAGAAGLSVRREDYEAIRAGIETFVADAGFTPGEDVLYYDLELRSTELNAAWEAQKQLAPFGEGCPQPVILLRDFRPVARFGETYRFMGGEKQHVKLQGPDFEIVAFNRADEFRELGLPEQLDIISTLSVNIFNGKATIQLKPIDFRASQD